MKLHYGYEKLELPPSVVTTGVFDGVHLGHRTVIKRLVAAAAEKGLSPVVVTFDPHPREVIAGAGAGIKYLSTLEEKATEMEKLGVTHLVVVAFSDEVRAMDACSFVEKILIEKTNVRHMVVGYNHQFGKGGKGGFDEIAKCAAMSGITSEQTPMYREEEGGISSTRIRSAVSSGKIEEANRMLGYEYSISGIVVKGKAIGRTIGYPTANILPENPKKLIPGRGVYAVRVAFGEGIFDGVLSIGTNPTVDEKNEETSIEVNIFGFSGDIYGKSIKTSFVSFIREEAKFSTLGELKLQIDADRDKALKILAGQ